MYSKVIKPGDNITVRCSEALHEVFEWTGVASRYEDGFVYLWTLPPMTANPKQGIYMAIPRENIVAIVFHDETVPAASIISNFKMGSMNEQL